MKKAHLGRVVESRWKEVDALDIKIGVTTGRVPNWQATRRDFSLADLVAELAEEYEIGHAELHH